MEVAKPIDVAKLRRARAPFVFDLGPATLVFCTIILISVSSLLYLTQASRVAATGYDISSLVERRAKLEREHQLLLARQAELQSLAEIERVAGSKLGMVPAPLPEFIWVEAAPVDIEAQVRRAEQEAQHRPRNWREQLAVALRLSLASAPDGTPDPRGS